VLDRFVVNRRFLIGVLALLSAPTAHAKLELEGNFEAQLRLFTQDALLDTQHDNNLSIALEPEFFYSWNEGDDTVEFVPFARLDQRDDERTHADIRELSWVHVGKTWESRIGIRKEFWGVTEFQHLVDIINQTDSVEDIDGEDKLGQPMVNLSMVRNWGIIDLFVLPYFRERPFSGSDGRPAFPQLNQDAALYEHSRGDEHVDYAARWSHSVGNFDLGVSFFKGTSRDPEFLPVFSSPNALQPDQFVPFYRQIDQYSLDLQATLGDTLWKLEAINNNNTLDDFSALQFGFEYSRYGVFDSNADLGWLMEYAWDSRGTDSLRASVSSNQNDLYLGSRLAFNDVNSNELLAGFSYDLDFDSVSFLLEASRRVGNNIKLALDVRLFNADQPADPLFFFRRDDHIQLTAQYYY
jgi:hypothetical protein